MRLSGARIHLQKIFDEDRSTRHEILNKRKARPSRGRKRVRPLCDCDATGPYSSSYRRTRISRAHLESEMLSSTIEQSKVAVLSETYFNYDG
ncbi:hypothetical protein Y032_0149g2730 [Ancylostoma ceylanicum]|uniref:Uncharacterized protein n=1 Tax=Ancylostoma ceylanicum TaxID=53326 RepID=A0A016T1L2_9BILA|nr:hypothetical protein Y032_0149g2730 [Ancylostoma ceylanicum]